MEPDDIQLRLYGLLVEQLHKYVTVFWQFPLALLAANFLALDKFLCHPKVMLVISVLDCVFVFAFYRFTINQRCIINATRKAEDVLKATSHAAFVPEFKKPRVPAPIATVCVLWVVAFGFVIYSLIRVFCS